MSAAEHPSKQEKALRLIVSALPALALILYTYFGLMPEWIDFSTAMPILVACSAICAVTYFYLLKQSMMVFLIAQVGVWVLFAMITMMGTVYLKSRVLNLQTCQVCGFKTLKYEETVCPACHIRVSRVDASESGYDNVQDYIVESQLIYFGTTLKGSDIDFMKPWQGAGNFKKDPAWRPSISEDDLRNFWASTDSLSSGVK